MDIIERLEMAMHSGSEWEIEELLIDAIAEIKKLRHNMNNWEEEMLKITNELINKT